MAKRPLRVAVVGATGLVGRTIIQVLFERKVPVGDLVLFASARSAGRLIEFGDQELEAHALTPESFGNRFDLIFFSAGADVSREHVQRAASSSALVIDNSSAFRLAEGIPLVVPEVNGDLLNGYRGVVANPNCSTIQMVLTLQPLHERFGLESVVVSTYQSVSGSGAKGLNALYHELETRERSSESPYPYAISLNVLPQIDVFHEDGWTGEERKMIFETRKILSLLDLRVVPTAVRVPVRVGHAEAVHACFRQPIHPEDARRVLADAPGIVVQDCPDSLSYPMPIHCEGRDDVFVGRIRQLPDDPNALSLWIVSDNLRKGAATNAVQIAERALSYGL